MQFLKCTSLQEKNIVPDPLCLCDGAGWGGGGGRRFESTYHFFFQCPNYVYFRRRYLSDYLPTFNTNQILCGKANVSVIEYGVLFSQVQEFVIHSKRFV